MCVLAVLQARTCVCVLFCFVIPSSILPIPCYFLSAATCINLPSHYCHYFYFFFQTHACAHLHSCRRAHARVYFFFSLAPILPTSAYVVLIFPRGRVLHTRICVSAFVPLRICVCFLISWGVPDLSRAGIPGVVSSHLPILL